MKTKSKNLVSPKPSMVIVLEGRSLPAERDVVSALQHLCRTCGIPPKGVSIERLDYTREADRIGFTAED